MSSLEEMIHLTQAVGVLTQAQVQDLRVELGTECDTSEAFLQAAVRRGFLTKMQLDKLAKGDKIGYFFGDFKALYMVGAGTFARVFRAIQQVTGQTAAIKVLRSRFSDNEIFIKHFHHEAQLGKQLVHPHIVPIFNVNSQDLLHFMVMEFVEGQTLREFVKIRKKVDAPTATSIVRDIADGLAYALKRGLQHRDLKLSNVLLSSSGQAKIVDFGLASIVEKSGMDVPFLRNQQSIDYVAIERAGNVSKNDHRSDVYFLGCMYYHMLCGQSPFIETKDRQKRMDQSRFSNVRSITSIDSTIPPAVVQVVEKAMQVKPDLRYQSPGAMLTDLEKLLQQISAGKLTAAAPRETETASAATSEKKAARAEVTQGTVMIVDSDAEMQNALREAFRKNGFRALIFSDAQRAVARLIAEPQLARCVLFSATSLGENGVDGFNSLGSEATCAQIPCLLILDEDQSHFRKIAVAAPHRRVLYMPLTIRQLREAVSQIIAAVKKDAEETQA